MSDGGDRHSAPARTAHGSGAAEEAERERLRRRLYRRGATEDDLQVFLESSPTPRSGGAAAAAADDLERNSTAARTGAAPRSQRWTSWALPVLIILILSTAITTGRVGAGPGPTVGGPPTVLPTAPVLPVAADTGPHPGAAGQATAIGRARYSYTAAAGDTVAAVADRFNVCRSDVRSALHDTTATTVSTAMRIVLTRRSNLSSNCP